MGINIIASIKANQNIHKDYVTVCIRYPPLQGMVYNAEY